MQELVDGKAEEAQLFDSFPFHHSARTIEHDLKIAGLQKHATDGKVDFHSLRTTSVTIGLASDADPRTIQQLARHKSLTMTDAYARAIPERVERAVEDLGEAIQKSKASSAVVKSLTCGEMKKAAGAESLQQQPLNSVESGGNESRNEAGLLPRTKQAGVLA